jgi:hypothetical protein
MTNEEKALGSKGDTDLHLNAPQGRSERPSSYDRTKYITGLGRDWPHPQLAHLYEGPFNDPGRPMCARGWNRDSGTAYSIWRNNIGARGICKVCLRRAAQSLSGVEAKR